MDRIKVIQEIINKKKAKTYLEIGVSRGHCFLKIKTHIKIGVDPNFLIPKKEKFIMSKIRNPTNLFNKYYKTESDSFFNKPPKILSKKGIDVAFIDGLHIYEQALVDVKNTLKYLKKGGVIILHDCNPITEESAYPAKLSNDSKSLNLPDYVGSWCGDVWKTIVNLRSLHQELNVFVLDCDYGLGIVTVGNPENTLDFSLEEIRALNYSDLEANREKFLNLKNTE